MVQHETYEMLRSRLERENAEKIAELNAPLPPRRHPFSPYSDDETDRQNEANAASRRERDLRDEMMAGHGAAGIKIAADIAAREQFTKDKAAALDTLGGLLADPVMLAKALRFLATLPE